MILWVRDRTQLSYRTGERNTQELTGKERTGSNGHKSEVGGEGGG